MDEQSGGLATRCHICYVRQGIYKCPKCLRRSCSVDCIKTHKNRSRCDGVRDPTEPKPLSWIHTPAGIDHDYNFISNIERKMARKNKELVEAGLFTELELKGYDELEEEDRDEQGNIIRTIPKDIRRRIGFCHLEVRRAPKGMMREKENKTSFNRTRRKGINWQVEWVLTGVREHPALEGKTLKDPNTRILHKAMEWKPLFRALESTLEWFRSSLQTAEEKQEEHHDKSKRRIRCRGRKRKSRVGQDEDCELAEESGPQNTRTSVWLTGESLQQDPITGSWNQEMGSPLAHLFDFYLYIPQWPSGPKTVLMPLMPAESLTTALCGRTIIEFPTIYVFPASAAIAPSFEIQRLERKSPGQKICSNQDQQAPQSERGCGFSDTTTLMGGNTTSSSESEPSEDGEIFNGEVLPPNPTRNNRGNNQGNQRGGRGRGRGRGSRDCRGGRGGGRGRRGGHHPDQLRQRGGHLNYNGENSIAEPEGEPHHQITYRGPRGNQRGGQRGRSHGGVDGDGHQTRHDFGNSVPSIPPHSLPHPAHASIPQKRTGEERGMSVAEAPPAKKSKASTGLVSYDSESGPEEMTTLR